jgi:hypothetical protein
MELRHLRGLATSTARQLLTSTIVPVVDYASNVWMHAYKDKLVGSINRVQRMVAQAIVGTFLTVSTSVAEAEAHITTAQDRFWKRAIRVRQPKAWDLLLYAGSEIRTEPILWGAGSDGTSVRHPANA